MDPRLPVGRGQWNRPGWRPPLPKELYPKNTPTGSPRFLYPVILPTLLCPICRRIGSVRFGVPHLSPSRDAFSLKVLTQNADLFL
jgi:hypothetical protein